MRLKLIASVTLLTLSAPLHAADLLEYYREAQAQDAAYSSAKFAYKAAQEFIPQAESRNNTKVNFGANGARGYFNRDIGGSDNFNTYGYSLSLAKPLYSPQSAVQVEQAKLQVNQAEAQLKLAEIDLIQRVAQAYFDVLLAQDNVALSGAQKKAISEQLAQAKRNFEVGTATIVDSQEAQARFDLSVAKEIADLNDLENRRRILAQIIGKMPDSVATLKEQIVLPLPQPNNMQEWVDTSEKQNLLIAIQRANANIAKRETERVRANYKPTVDLVGSFTDSNNSAGSALTGGNNSKDTRLGVQLAVPLWTGGLTQSQVRQSLANEEKTRFDVENARRTVAQQAQQAFLGVTSGVAQVKALEQSLSSSELALKSTRLGQEVGVRTGVDVLNAQQQVFQTRRDLFSARYNVILNQLRLKQASGVLTENDLGEVNTNLTK
jgi:outer membrane protein